MNFHSCQRSRLKQLVITKLVFRIRIRMSFIGQVGLHIQGILNRDRSSTVLQNDSDRTQTTKEQYTNKLIGNV